MPVVEKARNTRRAKIFDAIQVCEFWLARPFHILFFDNSVLVVRLERRHCPDDMVAIKIDVRTSNKGVNLERTFVDLIGMKRDR